MFSHFSLHVLLIMFFPPHKQNVQVGWGFVLYGLPLPISKMYSCLVCPVQYNAPLPSPKQNMQFSSLLCTFYPSPQPMSKQESVLLELLVGCVFPTCQPYSSNKMSAQGGEVPQVNKFEQVSSLGHQMSLARAKGTSTVGSYFWRRVPVQWNLMSGGRVPMSGGGWGGGGPVWCDPMYHE